MSITLSTPINTKLIDLDDEPLTSTQLDDYQSIIGSLNYFATILRWDIALRNGMDLFILGPPEFILGLP